MRCHLCRERTSWWRRTCAACRALWGLWQDHRFEGLPAILRSFAAAGIGAQAIERFLAAAPGGGGTIRDQIAADMSNELLAALGQGSGQSGTDVKRLRERGAWRRYDRRPEE
jgi:hypothetical protein